MGLLCQPRQRVSPLRLIGALGVGSLLLAACGNSPPAETDTSAGASASSASAPSASGSCAGLNTGVDGVLDDRGVAAATGATVTVDAGDSFFTPTCTTSVPRGSVTLTITNTGQLLHNVSVPALNLDMDVSPGQTVSVAVTVAAAPLAYVCKYHRISGMQGSLLPAAP